MKKDFPAYYEFTIKLPPETLRNKLWRLRCWFKRKLVCSWRGHARVNGCFAIWCDRCRLKLPATVENGARPFRAVWDADGQHVFEIDWQPPSPIDEAAVKP